MAKFQKELDHERKNDLETTEYEDNFMPNPAYGPWESDSVFDEQLCFDFFTEDFIKKSIEEFKIEIERAGLSQTDYAKIERGLECYAKSSRKVAKEKMVLLKSICNWRTDLLLEKFKQSDPEVRQAIGGKYFENLQYLEEYKPPDLDLILAESLKIYTSVAEQITIKRLGEWVDFNIQRDGDDAWADHINRIMIYRGINNSKYYNGKKQKSGDIISIYAGTQQEGLPYFEKYLLSSYTLSPDLAERFMVGSLKNKGQRRTLLMGVTEILENRILSSFLVSPNFDVRQFEFVCLPDVHNLYARLEFNTEMHAFLRVFDK